jgi:hypothetical protein
VVALTSVTGLSVTDLTLRLRLVMLADRAYAIFHPGVLDHFQLHTFSPGLQYACSLPMALRIKLVKLMTAQERKFLVFAHGSFGSVFSDRAGNSVCWKS